MSNAKLMILKNENSITLDKTEVITLNRDKRKLLIGLVPKIIDMSIEIKAFEDARDSVVKELNKIIKNILPENDMKILEKYHHIIKKTSFRPTCPNSNVSRGYDTCKFYFEVNEFKCPIEYSCTSDWSNLEWRAISQELFNRCEEVFNLNKQLEIIKNNKISAYTSLINKSKTLNQVSTVWEDVAEYLKGEITTEITIKRTITDEEVNMVKEDVSRRVKQ